MRSELIGPDRVLLLLALVPYLREHGSVPVAELAETFDVTPALLRKLVSFLGTAGVPGESLSYQDQDLFDIDWDALELYDEVSLTRTVAVEETPRFAPAETAALVAGLHALTGVLPAEDAELARAVAAKLGTALGASAAPAVSVSADADDPRVPLLVSAIDTARIVRFVYRDAAGVETQRTVAPLTLAQGVGAWYLRAYCLDREAERTFRVDQMARVQLAEPVAEARAAAAAGAAAKVAGAAAEVRAEAAGAPADAAGSGAARGSAAQPAGSDTDPAPAPVAGIVARVSARALSRLAGFSPEVLSEAASGELIVRVSAWHRDTAIRLVQLAPGEIAIESPAAAREVVRAWAERALAAYGE
ncbi:helix-turn-helix transcriptional regulator [Leucobacter luti]|uniref:WYL domain-containing protein n=1 Tax=Leucobacter luti TaxID=340320 RepID=A0A4Q7TP06_9MICO|nr:WYL domain-containing protein [Leucobacter luti]MBL3700235.1 WYL domain-containing transcriptional regulator [Leucobacter luti]RZT61042.1 WYL domain-containing protein [Leucobacter luti]